MSQPNPPSTTAVETADETPAVVSLSAQHLTARVVRDDGLPPALYVSDGELAIELSAEVGPRPAAALGLRRLAAAALAAAAELLADVDPAAAG
jgi:hypothetical protein